MKFLTFTQIRILIDRKEKRREKGQHERTFLICNNNESMLYISEKGE